jgi:hypothetical protein
MAEWCIVTGQPAASWLALTELQRDTFVTVAHEAAAAIRAAREKG